jgi:uncharacterized protein
MTSATTTLKPATAYTCIDVDGTPYLAGVKCRNCGAVFVGTRDNCGRCCTRNAMQTIKLSDRGRLYAYTIVYRSYPGIKVPFVSAVVDLDGGGTVKGNLLDIDPDPQKVRFDMPVRMVFRNAGMAKPEGEGYIAHFFVPD